MVDEFARHTLVFTICYTTALVGAGMLAATVRGAAVVVYLTAVWTDPVWLLGVATGLGLWLLCYDHATPDLF